MKYSQKVLCDLVKSSVKDKGILIGWSIDVDKNKTSLVIEYQTYASGPATYETHELIIPL